MLYNVMVALAVSFYSISEVLHVLMAVNLYIARIQGNCWFLVLQQPGCYFILLYWYYWLSTRSIK